MRQEFTLKQRRFIAEYVKNGGNGTQAALAVYDTTDPNTAHAIASENLRKPAIREELHRLLGDANVGIKDALQVIKDALNATRGEGHEDWGPRMRAADLILKLYGAYSAREDPGMGTR